MDLEPNQPQKLAHEVKIAQTIWRDQFFPHPTNVELNKTLFLTSQNHQIFNLFPNKGVFKVDIFISIIQLKSLCFSLLGSDSSVYLKDVKAISYKKNKAFSYTS